MSVSPGDPSSSADESDGSWPLDGPFKLHFFSDFGNFQLDIVGFLAILGEGSVLSNAQVATLSKWMFLPRLLPAPQALLRPSRPEKLEAATGFVTGVHSGNHRDYIQHIGNIVCNADKMDKFTVACVEITRDESKPNIKAKTFAPLSFLAAFGFVLSIILVALSLYYRDGFSLVATLLLSFLSTLIGVGNKWELQGAKRLTPDARTPPGDVVIRYPMGSFLVVKCDEGIARELYFAPEGIEYLIKHSYVYRLMSLVGTLMLMFGVIALGNSENICQCAFGASFILLNAAYWLVAALPARAHWDTSNFIVNKQRLELFEEEEEDTAGLDGDHEKLSAAKAKFRRTKKYVEYKSKTYTQALWKVIALTRSIDWVEKGNAAPKTEFWMQWLRDARTVAQAGDGEPPFYKDENDGIIWRIPNWEPQEHLMNLMAEIASPAALERQATDQLNEARTSMQARRRSGAR